MWFWFWGSKSRVSMCQLQASQKHLQLREEISAQLMSAVEDGRLEAALARQVGVGVDPEDLPGE